jgi:hypothetical protein
MFRRCSGASRWCAQTRHGSEQRVQRQDPPDVARSRPERCLARRVRDDAEREAGLARSIPCRGTVKKSLGYAQSLSVARFGITDVLLAVGASDVKYRLQTIDRQGRRLPLPRSGS